MAPGTMTYQATEDNAAGTLKRCLDIGLYALKNQDKKLPGLLIKTAENRYMVANMLHVQSYLEQANELKPEMELTNFELGILRSCPRLLPMVTVSQGICHDYSRSVNKSLGFSSCRGYDVLSGYK